jgi:hypothetical protein
MTAYAQGGTTLGPFRYAYAHRPQGAAHLYNGTEQRVEGINDHVAVQVSAQHGEYGVRLYVHFYSDLL